MNIETIEQEIRNFIVDNFLFGNDDGLTASQSLNQTGVIDSTGIMELVQFLEEQHEISVEDEDMLPENLDSIENVARFVHRKLDARAVKSNATEGAEI